MASIKQSGEEKGDGVGLADPGVEEIGTEDLTRPNVLFTKNVFPYNLDKKHLAKTNGHKNGALPRSLPSYLTVVRSKEDMLELVKDLKDAHTAGKVWEGLVFSRSNFAMGIFGPKGGEMAFATQAATLVIPEGALEEEQVIYFYRPVQLYSAIDKEGGHFIPYGPMIHLGPEGTTFKKPVKLTTGHCAAGQGLQALQRSDEKAGWGDVDKADVSVSGGRLTINLRHFTDVLPGSYEAGPKEMCILTLATRQGNGNATVDFYLLPNISGFIDDVLLMILNTHSSREVRLRKVVIDTRQPVVLDYDAGTHGSLRNTFTFPAESVQSMACMEQFVLQRQTTGSPPAASTSSSAALGSISVTQMERSKPLATVMITGTGHRIESSADPRQHPVLALRVSVEETAEVRPMQDFQGPEDARGFAVERGLSLSYARPGVQPPAEEDGTSGNDRTLPEGRPGRRTGRNASGVDLDEATMQESPFLALQLGDGSTVLFMESGEAVLATGDHTEEQEGPTAVPQETDTPRNPGTVETPEPPSGNNPEQGQPTDSTPSDGTDATADPARPVETPWNTDPIRVELQGENQEVGAAGGKPLPDQQSGSLKEGEEHQKKRQRSK